MTLRAVPDPPPRPTRRVRPAPRWAPGTVWSIRPNDLEERLDAFLWRHRSAPLWLALAAAGALWWACR